MDEVLIKQGGEPVMQFSVMLQNRAGALGSLVRLVRSAKVEIIGISIQDSKDATIVRMLVTDPDTICCLFAEKGIAYATCDMVVIALRESGIGLGACLEALMAAETNVDFAYSLMAHPDRQSLVALHLEDYSFGIEVLNNAGFKVLYQEDLSR
ncbi:hypothetical protein [Rubritalea sp.]|uniref:hypothetical protein n=1 Tax=Rubritalea sp. TaxID=2109375 RepID=UPI003EFAD5A2